MDQMQYMERRGSGFRKILDAYSNEASNTKKLKPEFYSTEQSFVVSLPNLNYWKSVAVTSGGTVNGGVEEVVNEVAKMGGSKDGGGVNGGVNSLAELVKKNPGLRANALAKLAKWSLRTVERHLRDLATAGKIEFRGVPKTGGYYVKESGKR